MIKAAIDIGTNSTRLLIARCSQDYMVPLYSALETTRIGEGLGITGFISPPALSRTLEALEGYMKKCREYGAVKLRIGATSAVRDAQNKGEVAQKVYEHTGIELEIFSGQKEAELSFLGAAMDFAPKDLSQQIMVLDIGGGSTELIYSQGDNIQFKSVNMGAVRLLENRELLAQMPKILWDLMPKEELQNPLLVGVGGTVTTVAAIKLGLEKYNPDLVHGSLLELSDIRAIGKELQKMSLEDRKKVKGLQPKRADIIPFGIIILEKVMELLGVGEIRVSEKDILYGMLIGPDGEC